MQENHISTYYRGQLEDFRTHLKKVRKNPDMEDIHQFRISVKKLKATWSLMEILVPDRWKKKHLSRLTTNLFRTAGKLREAQINQEIAAKQGIALFKPYIDALKKKEKPLKKRLVERAKKFETDKFRKLNKQLLKKMRKLTQEMVLAESYAFLAGRYCKIQKLSRHRATDKNLHKIRTLFKQVHEVQSMICQINISQSVTKSRKQVRSLYQDIGDWHDYSVLLDSVANSSLPSKSKPFKKLLTRTETRQDERRKKLYKQVGRYING